MNGKIVAYVRADVRIERLSADEDNEALLLSLFPVAEARYSSGLENKNNGIDEL